MNNEQIVTQLRKSKRAMVQALIDNGYFPSGTAPESVRISDFARYVHEGVGITPEGASTASLTIACVRKSDGMPFFLTETEWGQLTDANKNQFYTRGICIRALGEAFVIAKTEKIDNPNRNEATAYCGSFKAFTSDTGTWQIPTMKQVQIMHRWRDDLDAMFRRVWNGAGEFVDRRYWASDYVNGNYSHLHMASGFPADAIDTYSTNTAVRPIMNVQH